MNTKLILDNYLGKNTKETSWKLMIEGHTDSDGSVQYNLDLSKRRAGAAKKYLTDKGVAAGMISSEGYGESKPIAENKTAAGKAKNRRVVFTITKPDKSTISAGQKATGTSGSAGTTGTSGSAGTTGTSGQSEGRVKKISFELNSKFTIDDKVEKGALVKEGETIEEKIDIALTSGFIASMLSIYSSSSNNLTYSIDVYNKADGDFSESMDTALNNSEFSGTYSRKREGDTVTITITIG